MGLATAVARSFGRGKQTQTAGTEILEFIPPKPTRRPKITRIDYTNLGTAHTGTVMGALGKTKTVGVQVAGAVSLVLARDPGKYATNFAADGRGVPSVADNLIAANDFVAVRKPDGTWLVAKPSAASTNADGTVTLTVSALPTGGIAAGADVWFFGINTDTNPNTNKAHEVFPFPASVQQVYGGSDAPIAEAWGLGEPLLFHDGNATNAGTLNEIQGVYGL